MAALAPVAEAVPLTVPAAIPGPDRDLQPDLDRVIPTGFAALAGWDGGWYSRIAATGYGFTEAYGYHYRVGPQ